MTVSEWAPPAPHETVPLRAGRDVTYDIDRAIAPLIRALWDRGFWTMYSCQGNLGVDTGDSTITLPAYISFIGWTTAMNVALVSKLPFALDERKFDDEGSLMSGWIDYEPGVLVVEQSDARGSDWWRSVLRWHPDTTEQFTRGVR